MLSIITGALRSRNLHVWALAACAAIAASACDKLPLLAPGGSQITLSSNSSIVQANGTAEIRATVLESSGTPVQNGTMVSFTTNVGTISPAEARTTNGVAVARFFANGRSGTAQVRAISGGAASEPLDLSIGGAATGRVNVSANPTSVPASGGSATIVATVSDAAGNPLSGIPVTFSTTAGTFSATVVNTDASGTARTTLTTTREASVTATAGGTTSSAVAITTAAAPTVSISVAAGSTPVEGGITAFNVTANPGTGGAAIQNVTVSYGDGTSDTLGAVSGTFAVQHVFRDDGAFTPRVTAVDANGASTSASIAIFVQPLLVTLEAVKAGGTNVDFFASVSPDTTSVASYTWNFGDGTTRTTAFGSVSKTYNSPGTYNASVTVTTSTGHKSSGSTTVTVP